ncbi:MAG: hypothetical protein ACUVWR_04215 [Anaerolineae bacterium]
MVDMEMLRLIIAAVLFILGLTCFIAGLRLIFAKEYRDGMKELVAQSTRVGRRGVTEHSVAPVIDATSRLIDSVAKLVRTAFGMGAFLCLLGTALCLLALWIIGVSL